MMRQIPFLAANCGSIRARNKSGCIKSMIAMSSEAHAHLVPESAKMSANEEIGTQRMQVCLSRLNKKRPQASNLVMTAILHPA